MFLCTKCHGYPSNYCWDILVSIARRKVSGLTKVRVYPLGTSLSGWCSDIWQKTWKLWRKSQEIPKVSMILPLWTMNVHTKCHGYPSITCQDISLKVKHVNPIALGFILWAPCTYHMSWLAICYLWRYFTKSQTCEPHDGAKDKVYQHQQISSSGDHEYQMY